MPAGTTQGERQPHMDPLFVLQSILEIGRLKARYFRHVDLKEWAALAEIFTDDVTFDRSTAHEVMNRLSAPAVVPDRPVVSGRDEVVAMIRRAVENIHTVHRGFMPEIDVLSETEATGIWAMQDILRNFDGALILDGSGHYHETYRRVGGRWLISHIRLSRIALHYGHAAQR